MMRSGVFHGDLGGKKIANAHHKVYGKRRVKEKERPMRKDRLEWRKRETTSGDGRGEKKKFVTDFPGLSQGRERAKTGLSWT